MEPTLENTGLKHGEASNENAIQESRSESRAKLLYQIQNITELFGNDKTDLRKF